MPGSTGPNIGFVWGYVLHENGWGIGGFNPNFARLDTLLFLAVKAVENTPPGSPANGDRYIVGTGATGDWTGQEEKIAVYLTIGTPGWTFYTPKLNWRAWNEDTESYFWFDGSDWIEDTASGGFDITAPATGDVLRHDGTKFVNVRPMRGISFGSDPDELLDGDQTVFLHRFAFAFTIPADFADYLGASTELGGTVVATADTTFVVQKATNAAPLTFSNVGTISINAGTVDIDTKSSSATPIMFAKGDTIRIRAPTSPDATFKGVFGTIVGYET